MTILREVDYIYSYPKALWKNSHVPESETSNKWKQLQGVVTMYQEVIGFSRLKAKLVAWCWFLPNNTWERLKKKF